MLAKNANARANFYSTLAGFVEPGESLEETVHREVFEEVGIKVKNLKYFSNIKLAGDRMMKLLNNLIDIASFETLPAGAPWTGYRQFCEMFLFPLLLQAYKGIHFQPLMRSNIDGIGVQTAAKLFGFRDRFRAGVLTHVWLQAKLDSRFGNTQQNVRSDRKKAGFNQAMILANVRKLGKLIRKPLKLLIVLSLTARL